MQEILEKVETYFSSQLPFVVYVNPNSNQLKAFFQLDNALELFSEQSGFVFAPFLGSEKYTISEKNSTFLTHFFESEKSAISETITTYFSTNEKTNFENLVEKGIEAIDNHEFKKVVLSRKVTLTIAQNWLTSFMNLVSNYPSAFRYLFYHPKIGMWMGASPEQLAKAEGNTIHTVALAGTQLFSENLIWEEKEIQEQKYVTDFISNELKVITDNCFISKPITEKAGALAHIKTTISATLTENNSLATVLKVLHPTPAVCGLPKMESLNFIIANEKYDRKFYTGFLGEWNLNKTSNLFVNLRCMEVEPNQTHLYVGCGITKDSIPEKEFFETQNKLATMLKIINSK